jgi:hypothetical protein
MSGDRKTILDYAIELPAGSTVPHCERHRRGMLFVVLPVRVLADGEAVQLWRGWTCEECWTRRGYRLEVVP